MNLKAKFHNLVHDESGLATYITALFMATGLLLTMIIFVQIISAQGRRGFSLNGARSAAEGAAKLYAMNLSTVYPSMPLIGACNEPRESVHQRTVALYKAYYATQIAALSMAARAEARRFAQANYSTLDQGNFAAMMTSSWPGFEYRHTLTGALFQPTRVKVRTVNNYTSRGGQSHSVPAHAAAVAYMTDMKASVDYFYIVYECVFYVAQYSYDWNVALINEDR